MSSFSPATYTAVRIDNRVYQPNFVRWRHRFRGPRESLKVNQEIGQYRYDLNKSLKRLDDLDAALETMSDLFVNGGSVEGVTFTEDGETEAVVIAGFEDLSGRLAHARDRIRVMERDGFEYLVPYPADAPFAGYPLPYPSEYLNPGDE